MSLIMLFAIALIACAGVAIALLWVACIVVRLLLELILLAVAVARQQREAELRDAFDPMADSYGDVPRVVDRVWP